MTAVDIFKASRMKQIEDTTVVSGLVDSSGHLLLSTRAGESIDAGNVIGPMGPGFTYRGAWAANTPYAVRDVVLSNGSTFVVLTAHTSSTTAPTAAAPGSNLGLWAQKGTDGTNGLDGAGYIYRGAWAPSTAYAARDVVTSGGSTFLVTTAHTSSTTAPTPAVPGANLSLWAQKGTDGTIGQDGSPAVPAGTISLWASDTAPTNWMICDGSAISRTTYASLFAAIGTRYGAGDGVNTFNLPNLKGRTPIGKDAAQTEFATVGQLGGEKAHLLTAAESGSPVHTHKIGHGGGGADGAAYGGGPDSVTFGFNPSVINGSGVYQFSALGNTAADAVSAHNNLQPYSVVNFIIKVTNGDTPSDSQLTQRVSNLETFASNAAAGTITIFGGATPPTNWLLCDGSAVSRTLYPSLFAAIGTTYGAGDGSSTFNLPNLKGRVPVGRDAAQTEFAALAQSGGEKTHVLTINEMPAHTHTTPIRRAITWAGAAGNNMFGNDNAGVDPTGSTGGGAAHNVLQPYLTVNYIIKFTNGDTLGDSQLTQRVSAIETGSLKKTGTVSSLWTAGDPSITLSDNSVITAKASNRARRIRPGDQVLVENVSGTWYVIEVYKANGPEFPNFIPLPTVPGWFRPWYQESNWTLKDDAGYFRDLDPTAPFWLTKNSSGVVTIQGLAAVGTAFAATAVFATLPVGFRPSTRRLFPVTVNEGRYILEIWPTGEMLLVGISPTVGMWMTMGNVVFHAAEQDLNWINPTAFYNGFTAWSDPNYRLSYAIDSFGWLWFRGIVTPGTLTVDNNPMFSFPYQYSPLKQHHFAAATSSNVGYVGARPFTSGLGYLDYKTQTGTNPSWVGTDGIVIVPQGLDAAAFNGYGPGSGNSDPLGTVPWLSGWLNYDTVSFPAASFTKRSDGLVYWHGLVKTGTIGGNMSHLPRTYRPLLRTAFEKISAAAHGRLAMDPTDKAVVPEVGSNTWFSLDSTMYQAAR